MGMLAQGTRVGAYVIRRQLGAGRVGEVYLAEHQSTGRPAAIKVLLPEHAKNEELVRRLFAEARGASLVRHPGLVEILDCDVDPSGRAYIVMELLEGESLRAHLGRLGRLDVVSALAIVRQIAGALAAAHLQGITHRDLKPENVFLARSSSAAGAAPTVKVLDFGVGLGTPSYMAPEQGRDAGGVDHRADIYALGCITFELVSGRPPFVREAAAELMRAHIADRPPSLSSLLAPVPAGLGALIARMLEKDPERRPPSMREVADELGRVLDAPAGPAVYASIGAGRRAAITPIAQGTPLVPDRDSTFSSAAAEVTEPEVESPRARRRGRAWLLALAVAAAVAGSAGYRLLGAGKPRVTGAPAPAPGPALAPAQVAPPAAR